MAINNNENDGAPEEGEEQEFDVWSDGGAKRYNEMLDEGSAYLATGACLTMDPEADPDDEHLECLDLESYDPDEEA